MLEVEELITRKIREEIQKIDCYKRVQWVQELITLNHEAGLISDERAAQLGSEIWEAPYFQRDPIMKVTKLRKVK